MKRRKIISVVLLILLLFNLSIGVFAEGDPGPIRPKIIIVPEHEEQT